MTSLLSAGPSKDGAADSSTAASSGWRGMRLTGAIRREEGIATPSKVDSIYKPITERPEKRKFNALRVPAKLEAALPFASKSKNAVARSTATGKHGQHKRKATYLQSRNVGATAVVQEKAERDAGRLLQQMQAVQRTKVEKRREKAREKRGEHEKKLQAEEERKREKIREKKKEGSRKMGQQERSKA